MSKSKGKQQQSSTSTAASNPLGPAEVGAYFDELLAEGVSIDVALEWVAEDFGIPIAVSDAVYRCAPPADAPCTDATFMKASWDYFRERVGDVPLETLVDAMIDDGVDPYIAYGIASYWCAPEPGPGCRGGTPGGLRSAPAGFCGQRR